ILRVRIQQLHVSDLGKVLRMTGAKGELRFRIVASEAEERIHGRGSEDYQWMEYFDPGAGRRKELVKIHDKWNLNGEILKGVVATKSGDIGFTIRKDKQDAFFECTHSNSQDALGEGKRLAIILDDKILSAAQLKSGIRVSGIITGGMEGFKTEERKVIIALLTSGPLPLNLELAALKVMEENR
ncbi:MAG: SecDF P1 head subdomain-containing protein, partial [Planctomycetota bacterium]